MIHKLSTKSDSGDAGFLTRRVPGGMFALPFLLVFLLACCHTPPGPVLNSPKKTFQSFVKHIQNNELSKAYRHFSTDTRKRYKLNHFHGLMNKTKAGRLLQWKIANWSIQDVRMEGTDRAVITLGSNDSERTNTYELIREKTSSGKPTWRIRYFLADEMGVPRAMEKRLFQETGDVSE